MTAIYFVFGVVAALGAAAATLTVKGYLDLISDLTPEQREKVQVIRKTFLPKVKRIREDLCRERAALAELLFREPTDRAALSHLTDQIIGHQAELEHRVIEHLLEEKEVLRNHHRPVCIGWSGRP